VHYMHMVSASISMHLATYHQTCLTCQCGDPCWDLMLNILISAPRARCRCHQGIDSWKIHHMSGTAHHEPLPLLLLLPLLLMLTPLLSMGPDELASSDQGHVPR
jgi:hypothetical protein